MWKCLYFWGQKPLVKLYMQSDFSQVFILSQRIYIGWKCAEILIVILSQGDVIENELFPCYSLFPYLQHFLLQVCVFVIRKIYYFKTWRTRLSVFFCCFQTFEDSDLFHLIGVICGLAIYNFTIVDLHFPLALYKKLLKKKPSLDDLKELVPDVGRLVTKSDKGFNREWEMYRKLSFQE